MLKRLLVSSESPRPIGVYAAGVFMVVVSLVGLALGLILVETLTSDFRASLRVSRSAIASVGGTIGVAEEVATGTASSIEAAARSAASAAATTRSAVDGLESLADFLSSELPKDIEAVRRALPGAIEAADAVDRTLRALSLFGVAYSPDEPFGDSLRRVEGALDDLPDEIAAQSESLRLLAPTAGELAADTDRLARSLETLNEGLGDVESLTGSYAETVTAADRAVERTESSLGRTTLLLRAMVVLAALGGIVMGLALISIDRYSREMLILREAMVERVDSRT